jgi:hypothetical protein
MHIETPEIINLRNILFFQLFAVLAFARAENAPVIHRELLRIWKTLKTPLLPIKSTRTNHSSNKFWEIDMTKFEP